MPVFHLTFTVIAYLGTFILPYLSDETLYEHK